MCGPELPRSFPAESQEAEGRRLPRYGRECQSAIRSSSCSCHAACDHIAGAWRIQIRTSLAEPETGETFVPHKPARPDKAEGGKTFKLVVGL